MPITDAVNTLGALQFQYPEWSTLLGPSSGDPPGSADTFDNCRAVLVVQSASGSRMDFAELRWTVTEHLTDRTQPENFARMVAVLLPDAATTRLHLGDYATETESVEQAAESLTAQSQQRNYHFGNPVRGMKVRNPIDSTDVVIPYPITFNPNVDGQIRPNMSSNTATGATHNLWLHGEAAWNASSREYHDNDTPALWTLEEAVVALCEFLNPDETYIRGPSGTSTALLSTGPDIRDVTIPLGAYLPEALDKLLIPLGFNWYVDYATGEDLPIITIFEIGAGDEKELYFQDPGEVLNLEWSNVNQYNVARSIGDSFNQVRVLGDFKRYEVTLPLWPAWPDTDDSTDFAELAKDVYDGKENIWRLWIANEDGTIDPTEFRWGENPTVPDLSSYSSPWVPRRRTIQEPISYLGDTDNKERRPYWVEYSTSGGDAWTPVPDEWSVKLLPDQIGIYFDGADPPSELYDASDQVRVRITGLVATDERLEGLASKQSYAVNGRTIELVIDAADKFLFRDVLDDGNPFDSVLAKTGETGYADTRDDSTEIQDFAEKIRDKNHHAELDCEFRLPGWHLEYKIGDLITNIKGREISLDSAASTAPTSRYPQVVERRFEYSEKGPFTVLVTDRGVSQA